MMPATLSIITNAFPPEMRGKAIGTWAGVSGLALAIGPVVGGFLTEHVSWRAIFFLNLPVAAGAVAVTLFATRESRDETVERRDRPPGIAALSIGLTSLVLALIEGNSWGWGSPEIVSLLAVAAVALAAFGFIELRSRVPMVDFSFFRSRASSARTWSRSSSPSRCSPSSSSSRSTCRTSSATARSRPACASCPRRS